MRVWGPVAAAFPKQSTPCADVSNLTNLIQYECAADPPLEIELARKRLKELLDA
jgi:hypothetical protein